MMRRVLAPSGGWRAWAAALLLLLSPAVPAGAMTDDLLGRLGCGVLPSASMPWQLTPRDDGPLRILVIGSSSTSGTGAGEAAAAYPTRTMAHLSAKMAVELVAHGVGGERATGALARLGPLLRETRPHLLVWQVGTNDARGRVPLAELAMTLRTGIAQARAAAAAVVLVDPQYYPSVASDRHYRATVAEIAAVARQEGTGLVQRFARMERAEALGPAAMTRMLARDRFHMSALGHECLARDLSARILAAQGTVADG
ncbi:MAG: SGNH/GDSL hydrolase family protein [Pseudomonadota bacterium]